MRAIAWKLCEIAWRSVRKCHFSTCWNKPKNCWNSQNCVKIAWKYRKVSPLTCSAQAHAFWYPTCWNWPKNGWKSPTCMKFFENCVILREGMHESVWNSEYSMPLPRLNTTEKLAWLTDRNTDILVSLWPILYFYISKSLSLVNCYCKNGWMDLKMLNNRSKIPNILLYFRANIPGRYPKNFKKITQQDLEISMY